MTWESKVGSGARIRLILAIALFWMGLYLYVPVLTPYVVHVTGSAGLAGLVVASYGVPQLLSRALLAAWSDRWGRRTPFLAAGLILVAASAAGMAAWPGTWGFFGFRVLSGLAASMWAMFSIQYTAYLGGGRHMARAMGHVSFANNAGQVVAVLAGGLLAEHGGYPAPFWAAAVVGVVGLLLVVGLPEGAHEPTRVPTVSWRRLLRQRDVLAASALGILFQAGTFVTTFGYIPLWASREGLSAGGLGLLTAVALVPTAIMAIVTGSVLSRRWRVEHLIVAGFLMVAVGTGLTPWIGRGLGLYVTQGAAGVGRGVLSPSLMTWAVRGVHPSQRTTALAWYQSLYAVGMVGGPALAAAGAVSWGLAGLFWAAAALALAGALTGSGLLWWGRRRWLTAGGCEAGL